jgi:isoamylase
MTRPLKVWPGRPYPLGANWDGTGINFAIFSAHATAVELCLFDSPFADKESVRLPLMERTNLVWHGYVPNLLPGQLYAYRVHGPWAPQAGHRFNPSKLVMDPYAAAVGRRMRWNDALFGFKLDSPDLADDRDSAPYAPLGAVIDPAFSWGDDRPPQTPLNETVIYEMHVRGFTKRHPEVPDELRGSYLGLVSEPALEHLRSLGITAVELLPVHVHVDEQHLLKKGLSNYWGYNSLSFFAPDPRHTVSRTPTEAVREYKVMVRAFHAAGIEVILDVVYNHTGEGSHIGPTLSLRGIDNRSYYRLPRADLSGYEDFTGCGNTLDLRNPHVLRLVMDSLRYWVTEMHVDGFRFDLATALARESPAFDPSSAFLDAVHQDPVLAQVKLIAEPWDLGEQGYQVGRFPPGWSEWNGRYRDTVRRYWRGDRGLVPELATRLAGSSDLYQAAGRQPTASVNYVTCHDGFTLRDLVSYLRKHNEANMENNQDGESNNLSMNFGVEGPATDPAIERARWQQARNLLTTLFVSQGVPMLCAGDEMGRTQHGNNNAYCHDSELSWLDWSSTPESASLLEFTRVLIAIRHAHPALRRSRFLLGPLPDGTKDLAWLDADGREMISAAWQAADRFVLGMRVSSRTVGGAEAAARAADDDEMLVLFNAGQAPVTFTLPPPGDGSWALILDTAGWGATGNSARPSGSHPLQPRSVALFSLDRAMPTTGVRPRPRARPRRRSSDFRTDRLVPFQPVGTHVTVARRARIEPLALIAPQRTWRARGASCARIVGTTLV